jgi:hypothetical protein
MRATDKPPSGSGAEPAAQAAGTTGSKAPGRKAGDRPGVQRARRAAEWGQQKYSGSWAEYLWHLCRSNTRLSA